ncbi:MAG TPA: tetraacyldisaccharide 4'-kinase [Stellaceae bacterium]|nr:tetraacyldisaccharide 4'-kinase [Stellaceae bacterium]
MLRSPPEFWHRRGVLPALLAPLGWVYAAAGAARRASVQPWRAPVPVVCVGNLVVGGAGKTPVAISLARRLAALGERPHLLTRGYGGKLSGPLRIKPERHHYRDVGDEALLLATAAPTWLARDRVRGARHAVRLGASVLVLDDGFQNPSLVQDLKLVVVDGGYGFGNGCVMPAGPLRELVCTGLRRADAVVLLGPDRAGIADRLGSKPVLRGRLVPRAGAPYLAGERVVAFAGIGRPRKFFDFLGTLGAEVVKQHPFPDHHPYREDEIATLNRAAAEAKARLVTTEKDLIRVPLAFRRDILTVPIEVVWEDPAAVDLALARVRRKAWPANG